MGKIANNIYGYASRYKYVIVIFFGILIVGFLDENSILRKIEYEFEINDLKKQIAEKDKEYEQDQKKLKDISRNPKLIENIAREKYLMKTNDEDIFILSTDRQAELDAKAKQKAEENKDAQADENQPQENQQ